MSPSLSKRENREFASELKFVVAPETAGHLRNWAQNYLEPDPHAGGAHGDQYQITTLYFDTRNGDVFRRNGSYGRSKFRIRRYGEGEVVFLERKLKTRGLVTKRRSSIPIGELGVLAEESAVWPGSWFSRRLHLRALTPVCQISYSRTARVAQTQWGPIRLTIDQDLRAVPVQSPSFCRDRGEILTSDMAIVEMKFLVAMPVAFKRLVEEFSLASQAFSKYRFAARRLGLAPAEERSQPASNQLTPAYA